MQSVFNGAFSRTEEGGVILASSPVLRNVLAHQFAQERLGSGQQTWNRPLILTVDAWLASCWQEARLRGDVPVLLTPLQEILLWESIIAEQNTGLFDPRATAVLARQASNDIALWHIPVRHPAWDEHIDGAQFLSWRDEMARRCREKGWMTRAGLWNAAPDYVGRGWIKSAPISLVGFDVIPPALDQLRSVFPATVYGFGDAAPGTKSPFYSYSAPETEIEFAARWARERFETNAERSIAVFVPDLRSRRAEVTRSFDRIFYPSRAPRFDPFAPGESVFHVNARSPLLDEPLIAAAFLLLELAAARIRQSSATSIFRSHAIAGAAAERSLRAEADLRLRRQRQLDVSLRDMIWAARDCPTLAGALRKVQSLSPEFAAEQEPAAWSRILTTLLNEMGWPGDAPAAPHEVDLIDAWKDCLSDLAAIGLVRPKLTLASALSQLRRIAGSWSGSETGSWFSPVQIFDAADAAGLRFDCAIVTGLSESTWPPSLPLSPLIPLRLQAHSGIPASTPAGVHTARVQLTRSLFAAAPQTIATCVERLAPVARTFVQPAAPEPDIWTGPGPIEAIHPAPLEIIEDSDAPPFIVNGITRGGTYVIKSQSACPFKAWAEIRLRAQTPEEASFGFDALERGGFLHKALQFVWSELQSQARLKQMSDAGLQDIISRAVEQALQTRKDDPFFQEVRATEQERLCLLIFDWVTQIERARTIPFVVEKLEDKREIVLSGLPLEIRIDRVDRLATGGTLLIDYKSGKQEKKSLVCPRPREPQLLVYAAALGDDIEGVFFGQLKPRELDLVGKSLSSPLGRKRADPDWGDFLDKGRAEVERLAAEFLSGKAVVNPARGACDYCPVIAFCRKNESTAAEDSCE